MGEKPFEKRLKKKSVIESPVVLGYKWSPFSITPENL